MHRDVKFLIEQLGDGPLEATTLADFSRVLEERRRRSARQAQMCRSHLFRIARWAQSKGLVGAVQFLVAPRPEWTPQGRRPATFDEFQTYVDALPDHMRPLWLALGHTGARFTGMVGHTGARFTGMARLKEEDVADGYAKVLTKGNTVVRYPLTQGLTEAVRQARQFKKSRAKELREKGRGGWMGWARSRWVFLNSKGNPWTHTAYDAALKRIAKARALPAITPHQLRHMFGTAAATLGFSADMIQAGMGHRARRSSEAYIDHVQQMVDKVQRAFDTHMTQFRGKSPQKPVRSCKELQQLSANGEAVTCPLCSHKVLP